MNKFHKVRLLALRTATRPRITANGDRIVDWNTAPNYSKQQTNQEVILYERACDCVLNAGRCNCFSLQGVKR